MTDGRRGFVFKGFVLLAWLGFCLVCYATLVAGSRERLEKLESTESELRSQLESKQRRAANLPAFNEHFAQIKAAYAPLAALLPDRLGNDDITRSVQLSATRGGVTVTRLEFDDRDLKEFYRRHPFRLEVVGPYPALVEFLFVLTARSEGLFRVGDLSVESEADPSARRLRVGLVAYSYIGEDADEAGN